MARARAHPVPWEVLKRWISEQDRTNNGHLEDEPLANDPPPARNVLARIDFGSVAEGGAEYGGLRDDI